LNEPQSNSDLNKSPVKNEPVVEEEDEEMIEPKKGIKPTNQNRQSAFLKL